LSVQLIINGISIGAVYALIGAGFALVFGVLKFSNFAHGGVISVCAYAGYIFQSSFHPAPPFWVTAAVCCVAGMVVTYLVDLLVYQRLRMKESNPLFYFLASITFAILIDQVLTVNYGTKMYAYPPLFEVSTMTLLGITFSKLDMMMLAIAAVFLVLLILLLEHTRIGLAIRAVAINSRISRLMGINSSLIVTGTLVIAGFLGGITGLMMGIKYTIYPALGSSMMMKGFIASTIGGLGSLNGTIYAAVLLGIVEIICSYYLGAEITPVVLFGIMLVFLLIRPQGLAGRFAQDKA